MSMSDPIADLLTRIRNGLRAEKAIIVIPMSRVKLDICRVLKEEGYIRDYSVDEESIPGVLRIELKYLPDRSAVLQGVRRVSKPSLRQYRRVGELRPVRSGLGISIISTSRGVMTGKQAIREGIGGEVLCEVW